MVFLKYCSFFTSALNFKYFVSLYDLQTLGGRAAQTPSYVYSPLPTGSASSSVSASVLLVYVVEWTSLPPLNAE